MRMISKAVLAGIGALALGGTALAAPPDSKVIRVTYPDGSVQHIRYRGNVAPRILIVPVYRPAAPFTHIRQEMIRFDRMMAEMDQRMSLMMRQAAQLAQSQAAANESLRLVAGERLPPGTVRYSFVSTTSGGKTCSRSVRVIATDPDQPARVERTSSGDCAALGESDSGVPADAQAPKPVVSDLRRTI